MSRLQPLVSSPLHSTAVVGIVVAILLCGLLGFILLQTHLISLTGNLLAFAATDLAQYIVRNLDVRSAQIKLLAISPIFQSRGFLAQVDWSFSIPIQWKFFIYQGLVLIDSRLRQRGKSACWIWTCLRRKSPCQDSRGLFRRNIVGGIFLSSRGLRQCKEPRILKYWAGAC